MNTIMQTVKHPQYVKGKGYVDKSTEVFFSYLNVKDLDLYDRDKDEDFINQIIDIGFDEKWISYAFEEFLEIIYYEVSKFEGEKDKYIKNKRIFYAYKLDKNNKPKILGFIATDRNTFVTSYNRFFDNKECDYIELFAMKRGWRNKGIGRRLLSYTIDTLAKQENKAYYIGLYMCPENKRALRVYNLNGFEINQYRDGQAFMCKINDDNLRLLTDIACKGIELVYSNASNKYLNTYFNDIEFMSEKLENENQNKEEFFKQISDYVKTQKSGLKKAQELVEGFKKYKKESPFSTFRDYMDDTIDKEEKKLGKGVLKNATEVFKKPSSPPTKSRILKSMYIKLKGDIDTEKSNIGNSEMMSSYSNRVSNSDLKDRNR